MYSIVKKNVYLCKQKQDKQRDMTTTERKQTVWFAFFLLLLHTTK